jgi:hypothetical protein
MTMNTRKGRMIAGAVAAVLALTCLCCTSSLALRVISVGELEPSPPAVSNLTPATVPPGRVELDAVKVRGEHVEVYLTLSNAGYLLQYRPMLEGELCTGDSLASARVALDHSHEDDVAISLVFPHPTTEPPWEMDLGSRSIRVTP